MPKKRKNEQIKCTYFTWRLVSRIGVLYADGRSNIPNVGRHSLNTRDKKQAIELLAELDRVRAVELGLAPKTILPLANGTPLPLEEGRRLYEAHLRRPRVTGGVKASTAKRYKAVLDKFLPFAATRGVTVWNGVNADLLTAYAAHLEDKGYLQKTLLNELTVLKQLFKWLIQEKHLLGSLPIELKLEKAESERAYCYRSVEVAAMVEHCRSKPALAWMANVIVALACTGLRIAELCSLQWRDLELERGQLRLADETGRRPKGKRRELKSGRSRCFPIHGDLAAVLAQLPRRGEYVFYGPRDGRLKPDTVRNILVRDVIKPLAAQFASQAGEKSFGDGRLHSFRHYFISTCANNRVPEQMVMEWVGHKDSEMVRHYYHLHDDESQRQMSGLNFLGGAGGRSAG